MKRWQELISRKYPIYYNCRLYKRVSFELKVIELLHEPQVFVKTVLAIVYVQTSVGLHRCQLVVHECRPLEGALPCHMAIAGRCGQNKKNIQIVFLSIIFILLIQLSVLYCLFGSFISLSFCLFGSILLSYYLCKLIVLLLLIFLHMLGTIFIYIDYQVRIQIITFIPYDSIYWISLNMANAYP